MKEIALTRGYVALVDDDQYERIAACKWYAAVQPNYVYAARCSNKRIVWMHRVILDARLGENVDHVDGDGLNNQRSNLRLATRSQNQQNQRKKSPASSRFKGVSWNKGNRKWESNIQHHHVRSHLGSFTSEVDAAKAYDSMAYRLFGEFAKLNL